MPSDLLVLAFDTSAAHCAAALLRGDRILAQQAEEMGCGQAERLMPMLEEMLAQAGVTWRDLDRIGVGIGPGNFTGIRISVAAARGLALALECRAIGVSTFAAIHFGEAAPHAAAPHAAIVPAPREQVYLDDGTRAPALCPLTEAVALGLRLIAPPPAAELALRIARIAATSDDLAPPAPLYIRAADAAPSRDMPPRILAQG